MDSLAIAYFLESTYPHPPLQLESSLGDRILADSRRIAGQAFRNSLMPRKLPLLSPSAQDFFRRTREPALGHPIEDLLPSVEEFERVWDGIEGEMKENGEMMRKGEGRFIEGKRPCWADFCVVGNMCCARVVDGEGVFGGWWRCRGMGRFLRGVGGGWRGVIEEMKGRDIVGDRKGSNEYVMTVLRRFVLDSCPARARSPNYLLFSEIFHTSSQSKEFEDIHHHEIRAIAMKL